MDSIVYIVIAAVAVVAVFLGVRRLRRKKPTTAPQSPKSKGPAREPGEGPVVLGDNEPVTGQAWFKLARGNGDVFLPEAVASAHGLGELVRGKPYYAEWVWNAKKKRFDVTVLRAS